MATHPSPSPASTTPRFPPSSSTSSSSPRTAFAGTPPPPPPPPPTPPLPPPSSSPLPSPANGPSSSSNSSSHTPSRGSKKDRRTASLRHTPPAPLGPGPAKARTSPLSSTRTQPPQQQPAATAGGVDARPRGSVTGRKHTPSPSSSSSSSSSSPSVPRDAADTPSTVSMEDTPLGGVEEAAVASADDQNVLGAAGALETVWSDHEDAATQLWLGKWVQVTLYLDNNNKCGEEEKEGGQHEEQEQEQEQEEEEEEEATAIPTLPKKKGKKKTKKKNEENEKENTLCVVTGQMYAYDPYNGLIILQCPPSSLSSTHTTSSAPVFDFRWIHTQAVRRVSLLAGHPSSGHGHTAEAADRWPGMSLVAVRHQPMEQIYHREQRNIQQMQQRYPRVNAHVDGFAQALFDALHKTMACCWSNTSIVVMNSVVVHAPYTVHDCHGEDTKAVERVRKVLQGERQRLEVSH